MITTLLLVILALACVSVTSATALQPGDSFYVFIFGLVLGGIIAASYAFVPIVLTINAAIAATAVFFAYLAIGFTYCIFVSFKSTKLQFSPLKTETTEDFITRVLESKTVKSKLFLHTVVWPILVVKHIFVVPYSLVSTYFSKVYYTVMRNTIKRMFNV